MCTYEQIKNVLSAGNIFLKTKRYFEKCLRKLFGKNVQTNKENRPTRAPRHSRAPVDESKIIRQPNYHFIEREWRGKIYQKLIVFNSEERKMCFEYTWSERDHYYICNQCASKDNKHVSAKVIRNGDDEYIQLGVNDRK
uniref:Uncharacterized protein n=1 Tax=Panagrolaimus sp. ES5 TaxID=591445 RepID=A0AC34FIX6_9BILA